MHSAVETTASPISPHSSATQPRSRGLVALVYGGRHPRLVLIAIVLALFGPSLIQSFAIDDYRNLRLLDERQRGVRTDLRLYEFLRGGADNRAQRLAGLVPWWVPDELRFTYFRPVTQAMLQAEYAVFGRRAIGYRLFGLGLYCIGVCLVLALYREWNACEPRARWAAVAFAVAGSNAIPAAFIAAQCDLLALVGCVGALLCAARFIRGGHVVWLAAAIPIYAAALLSKEAAVAAAVLPLACVVATGSGVAPDERRRRWRRAMVTTATLLLMALALIGYYARQHYGSNGEMILDPFGHPSEFLKRAPARALMLLASWLLPVNPQWFDMFDWMRPWGHVFLVLGAVGLAAVAIMLFRHHRRDPAVRAFSLWVLPFLPLLACTNPDNRVMMLPAVGLSMLAAVWMTADQTDAAAPRLKRLPAALFVILPFMFGSSTVGTLGQLERQAAAGIRAGAAAFDRQAGRDDFVFFLNTYWQFDAIWTQDRADFVLGSQGPRVSYLSHVPVVETQVIGLHTLRLRTIGNPLFSTYPGRLVLTRDAGVPRAGTEYDAGEFTATIREVRDGRVWVVDFDFRQRLDSPHYRFMRSHYWNPPQRWIPGQ